MLPLAEFRGRQQRLRTAMTARGIDAAYLSFTPNLDYVTWRFLRNNPLSLLGVVLVAVTFLLVLATPIIAPFDPPEQTIRSRMQPPGPVYWFGTGGFGRGVLSRVLYGGRLSLPVALLVNLLVDLSYAAIDPRITY